MASSSNDQLSRFLILHAGVRGVHVQLDDTWRQIRGRATDIASQAAIELLGEAAAAAALFTGHAKIDGRLSVQLRSDGPLRTLFAECTAAGTLRGILQLNTDDDGMPAGEVSRDLRTLGDNAVLAITIENPSAGGHAPMRYQGLVALESDALSGALEAYFRQSEQLPTRLLLAADDTHVAGLMLQKLPGDEGDDDGWIRASALFDTLGATELLAAPAEQLLLRLFHEDGVQMLGSKPLRFACSCSRDRVASMLASLGEEEALATVAAGEADIRCEFCGQHYRFDLEQIRGLLAIRAVETTGPERLQ